MERVKNKNLKPSSKKWLFRHINDAYVHKAKAMNYRSRASFKLIEIDEKFKIFNKKSNQQMRIVDLGCAPGGWTQVAMQKAKNAQIIGVDLLQIKPIPGVQFIHGDFCDYDVQSQIKNIFLNLNADKLADIDNMNCSLPEDDVNKSMNMLDLPEDRSRRNFSYRKPNDNMEIVLMCDEIMKFTHSCQERSDEAKCSELRKMTDDERLNAIKDQKSSSIQRDAMNGEISRIKIDEAIDKCSESNQLHSKKINAQIDLILSDISPSLTGHRQSDIFKMEEIAMMILNFSAKNLAKNGSIVLKYFQSGNNDVIRQFKKHFKSVKLFKPNACRAESIEIYLIAQSFFA